jgi:hypothetical protein
MEKMRSLDGKLKQQIDRLIKLSTKTGTESASSSLRPNPLALLAKGSGGNDDSDDDNEEMGTKSRGKLTEGGDSELYRAPKMAAAPYKVKVLKIALLVALYK